MGITGVLGKLAGVGKKKAEKGIESLYQLVVKFDPETASAAELEDMERRFDKLNLEVSKAKTDAEKERRESDEINKQYHDRLAAAEKIQETINLGELSEKKLKEHQKALDELVTILEEMKADVEREEQEAIDAEEFLGELEQANNLMFEKLKGTKKELDKASKEMKKARMEEERAKDREERARIASGLLSESDFVTSALTAMQKEAEKSREKADAADRKASLLKPAKSEETNSIISDALKDVKGEKKPESISARLAALKK